MVRTLDRYLIREAIVPFLIGTFAVVLMLLGGILYDNAAAFFGRNVPLVAVAQLLLYRIPYLLVLTMPAGTVVAVSLVVTRMARDSEITVMRAAGVPLWRILTPLFAGALLVSAVDFVLSERVMPPSQEAFQRLFYRILYMQPEPLIRPNVMFQVENYSFVIGQTTRQGDQVLVEDVSIFEKTAPGSVTAIYAKSGLYDAGKWTLNEAWVYHITSDGDLATARTEREVVLNLRADFGQFYVPPPAEGLTMRELSKRIEEKRRQKLPTIEDEVNWHTKLSIPAACFFLALVAPALALIFARSGSFVGVLLSIVLVFVYWNTLLLFVRILGYNGFMPPALAAWAPNLLFGVVGLWLLRRIE